MNIASSLSTTSPYVNYSATSSSNESVKIDQNNNTSSQNNKNEKNITELNDAEKLQVAKLQQRDAEVRTHEASHMAAGAGLTSGASFTYQKGPDAKMYAVGGEVSIDTSPGKTPEETIQKARQIKQAALAPANPSPADLKVAANAASMEAEAKSQIQQQKQENGTTTTSSSSIKSSAKNPYNQNAYTPTTIGIF